MKKSFLKAVDTFISSKYPLLVAWFFFLVSPLAEIARYRFIIGESQVNTSLKLIFIAFIFFSRYLIIPVCAFLIFLWMRKYTVRKLPKTQQYILQFIAITSALFFTMNIFLLQHEQNRFPNYLYSKIGVKYESLVVINRLNIFILSLLAFVFYKKNTNQSSTNKDQSFILLTRLDQARYSAVLAGLLITFVGSFYPLTNAPTLIRNARMNNEQKFGPQLAYVMALSQQVPEEGKIIHPPQVTEWYLYGNQPMIRYFLFPRTLISGAIVTTPSFSQEIGQAYFAQIKPDGMLAPWPLINLEEKTITFDAKTSIRFSKLEKISEENNIPVYLVSFYE